MTRGVKAAILIAAGIVCISVQSISSAQGQSVEVRADVPKPKVAEEVFKNIQVMKGTPADQLIPAMQFFTASLGVPCDYCHVDDRSKDDKKAKQTARSMIQMMLALDKANFDGRPKVTCYSCHHGAEVPPTTPSLAALYSSNPLLLEDSDEIGTPKPGAVPSADQLLQKYLQSVGGDQMIGRVTSLVEKGTADVDGQKATVEIFCKVPDQRLVIIHTPGGDTITSYDGRSGWISTVERGVQDMRRGDLDAARMDADPYFPVHAKQVFGEWHVGFPTTVDEHDANVVMGTRAEAPPVKLYFDPQSGLLLRLVRYVESTVGRIPTQIDYADYREVNGLKMPFQWTVSQVNTRLTVQLTEIQQNLPIDASKFVKPAPQPKKP